MIRFYYGPEGEGKLVRDTIDKKICSERHVVKARYLEKEELAGAILDKMPEELAELKTALARAALGGDVEEEKEEKEELADVMALLGSYIKVRGFEPAEIERIRDEKARKRGAFDMGTFIEYVDLNPEGEDYEFWLKHFRENSDRYVEEEIDE
jgi:predicted house-cleaning noncanonical NTP pyrophosphatase (MazG superfamily)